MNDSTFLVGIDLVEFDRRDLPIYQMAQASWDCSDEAPYGAPLDRLLGEPGDPPIDGAVQQEAVDVAALGHDPLVALAALSEDPVLAQADAPPAFDPPQSATIVQFGAEAPVVVHLHDGWSWDASGADWTFDFRG